MALSPKTGTRPMLELAAESIARISGVDETVVDVLHGRAFKHYAEALRQYLATRVADLAAADAALNELRAIAAAKGADELTRPPGIRGNLYRMAREVASHPREGLDGEVSARRAKLPWRAPKGQDDKYGALLTRLRAGVPDDAQELLELRYARELTPNEIAHVVARPIADVDKELSAALLTARSLMHEGDSTRSGRIEQILLEAFSLELPAGSMRVDPEDKRAALAEGTVIGGRYVVQECVGSGSFADVYRAADQDVPGHVVALKLLHQPSLSDEAKQSALRELHIIASVFHPSVVQFKDHGWHESRLWFVMPWYKGETLDARISRGPLSRREARDIFEPLARALATMHESGIRHQDVKPDNIFLAELPGFATAGGVLPVLLDLGVAAKEAEMVVAGTPTYFAPEVAAQFAAVPKPHPIGSKADVFSLALSLKNSLEPDSQDEVAAGAVETFIDHRAKEPPEPPLDADLRFLRPHFEKWMAMDPGERPTAQELASQLAILTAPEDRRARLISLAKWLGPLLATLAVTFAAVVFIMDREARLQELEAEQARLEAAETRDSLVEEEGRRRALEVDVRHARDEYERSELTRGDLANRLAETEGDLTATRGGLREERARTRGLRDRLGTAEGENVRLTGELVATRDTLDRTERTLLASERHAADLSTQLDTTRTELGAARADAERERRRVAELTTEAGTLRSQLAGSRAEAADLQRQIATAEQARSQAAADLAAAQRRIADLERQLAAARNRPATTPPITSMVREESEPDVPAPAPGPTVRTGADP